ncbi:uncharacterized protein LOC121529368 [Cheilinus undulatus]|uniref:uncharacterized protein LOC121529368 n=1 Tax=Cheilinus undulatus TaxID=241271 RepID=UPI001BD57669|nr:uncharacterized protein LOC121529368 [Cheilinus undulatus]
MTSIRHQNFRSFLTERFTSVAVEIFGEVEAIIEAYYEENKRLRNVLHMVVNPEIKLPRIDDDIQHTGATPGMRRHFPDYTREESMVLSEPVPACPKEEEIEYDIGWGSAQQQQPPPLGEASNIITTSCVKDEPDSELAPITESCLIEVVEVHQDTSGTVSADEVINDEDDVSSLDSGALADFPHLSISEDNSNESVDSQNRNEKPQKTKQCSQQKTILELPRMMPFKSVIPDLSDCPSILERLTEAFKDFPEDQKPLITKMGICKEVDFVECAFGKVPKGSPLSYQHPVPSIKDYQIHNDAPPRPEIPLPQHILEPLSEFPTLSAQELERLKAMQINWDTAQSLESSTRPPNGQKEVAEEMRKQRLTSRFREICKFNPGQSNAKNLIYKIQSGVRKCKTAQIDEEMKAEALREYCRNVCVNWSPCGLVIHPNAPWLGALPDGLVYDPKETPSFGLVHVKCIQSRSFVDGKFLSCQGGMLQLKKDHTLYWHVQGEMMIAGMSWCDLLVISNEDILVQRIYRDKVIIDIMKKKLEDFFFYYYLPSLL